MAEVSTGGNDHGGKGKPKKMSLRVDFTPMVDMNMLLITFFMFCTSLSKPQIMELVLPVKEDQMLTDDEKNKVKDSKAITVILGADDKVYYYFGKITKESYDYNAGFLKETTYSPQGGIRDVFVGRNGDAIRQIVELKTKKVKNEITDDAFKEAVSKIKDDPNGVVIVIKPSDESTYKNMIDMLDEMQICGVGKYALIEMSDGDTYLLRNHLSKGAYAQEGKMPPK
jgi:biopolymer transport protein ExbD